MEALIAVLILVLLIRWLILRSELSELRRGVEFTQSQLRAMTQRLWVLEGGQKPPPEVKPPEVKPAEEAPQPKVIVEPLEPAPAPARDIEALVGGNLLNKAGALVLVIGLALFLGYSFTMMGPVGRVATSLVVSLAMLGGGVLLERRDTAGVFARGLIGAGWAALYFTLYAMGAVTAAKVLHEPVVAALLLLAVAAGMVAHSLRYASEAATLLAYFSAFAALAVSESTPLAVVALAPLAASLAFLAHKQEWGRMAIFGVVATYGVLIWRGDSGAPLWQAQVVFLVYWLVFEVYGIRRPNLTLFALNAMFFLGLSFLKWDRLAHANVSTFFSGAALLYAGGAILRGPGYAAPLSVAALMAALALTGATKGVMVALGLGAEAALLFEFGLRKDRILFRAQGYALWCAALIALAVAVGGKFEKFAPIAVWGPVAIATVAGYAFAWRVARGGLPERNAVVHASAAAGGIMGAMVLWCVLADVVVAMAWMAMAVVLARIAPLARHGELLAGAAVVRLVFGNFTGAWAFSVSQRLFGAVPVAASLYASEFLAAGGTRVYYSVLASVLVSATLFHEVSGGLLTVAWASQGLVLLGVGFPLRQRVLRWSGLVLLMVCILKLFVYDLRNLETFYRILSFLALGAILMSVSWFYSRVRRLL